MRNISKISSFIFLNCQQDLDVLISQKKLPKPNYISQSLEASSFLSMK